jgi:integrase
LPKKAESQKVLDGRAEVCSYTRAPEKFFLRVFIPEKRGYESLRIEGVSTLEEACSKALDSYLLLSKQEKPRKVIEETRGTSGSEMTSIRRVLITDAVQTFLTEQDERVEAGMLKPSTVRQVRNQLRLHFLPYCKETGLLYTKDIKVGCLDKYPVLVKCSSRNTIRTHIATIGQFLNSLSRKRLMNPYEASLIGEILPTVKVRQEDKTANPPFRAEDWEIFKRAMKKWREEAEKEERKDSRKIFHRRRMTCFVMLLHQTGMRPDEALNLRWKDLEVVDIGRFSETKFREEIEKRDEELYQIEQEGIVDVVWDGEDDEEMGRTERLISHLRVLHSKTGQVREVTSNSAQTLGRLRKWTRERVDYLNKKNSRSLEITEDTRMFDNPLSGEWKTQMYNNWTKSWHDLLARCEGLKGPILSEKPYTIYSLRSSRAQWMLEQGVDLAVATKQLGHSPQMLLSTYSRLPVRERAVKEAAHIEYGRKKDKSTTVDVDDI